MRTQHFETPEINADLIILVSISTKKKKKQKILLPPKNNISSWLSPCSSNSHAIPCDYVSTVRCPFHAGNEKQK